MSLFKLDGKVAIVYGGSYGIGKGISQCLALAGANVIIVARGEEKGKETVAMLKEEQGHLFIKADVSVLKDHEHVVESVIAKYKKLDIIVCCAGIYPPKNVEDADYDENYISKLIDVNLKGTIYAVKTALPYLKQSPAGRIIFISSITGEFTGFDGFTVYGATKSAQIGYARSAAVELAKHKITVNCVLPGSILTEGLVNLGPEYIDDITKAIPLNRLGTPKDIGHAVLFLASEEAAFITGQEITVDGGQVRPEAC